MSVQVYEGTGNLPIIPAMNRDEISLYLSVVKDSVAPIEINVGKYHFVKGHNGFETLVFEEFDLKTMLVLRKMKAVIDSLRQMYVTDNPFFKHIKISEKERGTTTIFERRTVWAVEVDWEEKKGEILWE